jgi:hypothetical protein
MRSKRRWTDTRTGIQELWTDIVSVKPRIIPPRILGEVAEILVGIIQDGGGVEIVGGHIIRIPPWGPEFDILLGIATHRIATLIAGPEGIALQRAAMTAVAQIAKAEIGRLASQE